MVADARPAKSVAEAMPHAAATIAKRLRILVIFQSVIFDFLKVVKCEPSGRAGRFSDRKQPGAWGIRKSPMRGRTDSRGYREPLTLSSLFP